jgi:hypothetical protein
MAETPSGRLGDHDKAGGVEPDRPQAGRARIFRAAATAAELTGDQVSRRQETLRRHNNQKTVNLPGFGFLLISVGQQMRVMLLRSG